MRSQGCATFHQGLQGPEGLAGQRRWSVREPQGQARPLSPPRIPKAQSKGVPGTYGLGAHIRPSAHWPEGAEEPSPASRRARLQGAEGSTQATAPCALSLAPPCSGHSQKSQVVFKLTNVINHQPEEVTSQQTPRRYFSKRPCAPPRPVSLWRWAGLDSLEETA